MALMVYMTMSDGEEARRIGAALVERRLAACVNILPPIQSIYWWEDAVQQAEEVACVAKTEEDRFEELCAAVRSMHSYETPCIVALPLAAGDRDFLTWLRESTRPRR